MSNMQSWKDAIRTLGDVIEPTSPNLSILSAFHNLCRAYFKRAKIPISRWIVLEEKLLRYQLNEDSKPYKSTQGLIELRIDQECDLLRIVIHANARYCKQTLRMGSVHLVDVNAPFTESLKYIKDGCKELRCLWKEVKQAHEEVENQENVRCIELNKLKEEREKYEYERLKRKFEGA